MPELQTTLDLVRSWWDLLPPVQQNDNLPAKGTIAGALVVLESLKQEYILDIGHYRAERGASQLKGVGKSAVQRILAVFGETRPFLKEGGRTNRGLAGDVSRLLSVLELAGLDRLTVSVRNHILTEVQRFPGWQGCRIFQQGQSQICLQPREIRMAISAQHPRGCKRSWQRRTGSSVPSWSQAFRQIP